MDAIDESLDAIAVIGRFWEVFPRIAGSPLRSPAPNPAYYLGPIVHVCKRLPCTANFLERTSGITDSGKFSIKYLSIGQDAPTSRTGNSF